MRTFLHENLQKALDFFRDLHIIELLESQFASQPSRTDQMIGGWNMLYIALFAFVCLVGWMVREQGHESCERENMENFYRAEYQRAYPMAD